METAATFDEVRDVLVRTLGIEDRAADLRPGTELFGSLPELDSLAVLELVEALEERFDVEIDDDELTGDTFATLGTLTDFVDRKRA